MAADYVAGDSPVEVLCCLENPVPVEGGHVEGGEELDVLFGTIPGFRILGEMREERVVAE